ncbi:SDR family oxidoreductase [Pseudomonas sp. NPDC007930]|uniref:SDR family oxidoreductase n=1 Tax=Pseudomonas sp. NPDC007930 TaxID=3364417 RepID=UPI0036EA7559
MSTPYTQLAVAITGGAQGIGRRIGERLAALGARVALIDRNLAQAEASAAELRAAGFEAIAVGADVTRAADCAQMVAATVEAFGRLDLMVCNAGIIQVKPFMEITEADWDPTFAVNVKGLFFTLQAAARQMREQPPLAAGRPRGKIVTLSSIAGRYGAGPMAPVIPHYRASKAAVISITQSAAYTLAPDITVNAVCPGLVETDMWQQIDREWSTLEGWNNGEAWKRRTAAVPLGRPQSADDVAGMVEFLAGPAADYMTGQALNIDGGLAMN